jgi:Carboxylesterase family
MMHRRSFLATLGAGYALAELLFWTVETASGKVQGISNTGIKEFKGIPYGAPTGGKNRYMPPQKPASWTGVRECFSHGQISPQTLANLNGDYGMMIQWDLHVGGMGEDCLSLNVWTPGVNDGGKRAVMVLCRRRDAGERRSRHVQACGRSGFYPQCRPRLGNLRVAVRC